MIQKLLVSALMLVILGGLAFSELRQQWDAPLLIPEAGFVLTIEQGDSLRSVANNLNNMGILAHPSLLIFYGRWTGIDQAIKRGEYRLLPGLTAEAMLKQFSDGDVIHYQVTFPEGITLAKALGILAQQAALETVLTGPSDPQLMTLIKPYLKPEGLFFPDTYRYLRGDTDLSILERAHAALIDVLQKEWGERASGLPYETPYDALIMASIIERETGLASEREQISGVFVRRLEQGMLLQTDPTVIYGMGTEFDGNLRRRHLKDSSNAYNTYRHSGLPPTPIALSGRAAIYAALHPAETNALYFVARGDGGHVFSRTLAEHNRAVGKFQLQRRENYTSSPEGPQ
ncbi:MAG: endolytic transglycosylase MltG [Halioglobus sp.]|nr:endolytic transglycosylase MltG [Halioglobus sp.]